jgi:hypothetical protein
MTGIADKLPAVGSGDVSCVVQEPVLRRWLSTRTADSTATPIALPHCRLAVSSALAVPCSLAATFPRVPARVAAIMLIRADTPISSRAASRAMIEPDATAAALPHSDASAISIGLSVCLGHPGPGWPARVSRGGLTMLFFWMIVIGVGSLVAAFAQGVLFGGLCGVTVRNQLFVGATCAAPACSYSTSRPRA